MNIIEIKKISASEAESISLNEVFTEKVMQGNADFTIIKSNQGRGTYVATLVMGAEVLGFVYFKTDIPVRNYDGNSESLEILVNAIIDEHCSYCTD